MMGQVNLWTKGVVLACLCALTAYSSAGVFITPTGGLEVNEFGVVIGMPTATTADILSSDYILNYDLNTSTATLEFLSPFDFPAYTFIFYDSTVMAFLNLSNGNAGYANGNYRNLNDDLQALYADEFPVLNRSAADLIAEGKTGFRIETTIDSDGSDGYLISRDFMLIPEPTTGLAILGLGYIMTARRRRRSCC